MVVGGFICVMCVKRFDGIPEFCLVAGTVEIACLIMIGGINPKKSKGEIFMEEAKAAGRVVTAHQVKEKHIYGSYDANNGKTYENVNYYKATYEYEINGSTYQKKMEFMGPAPSEVTFYYAKNKPRKVITSSIDIDEPKRTGKIVLINVLGFVMYGILKLVFDVDYSSLFRM